MTLGFIMTRHVNSEKTNNYWNESYKCIRRIYPNIMIMIVDDNSNRDYVMAQHYLTNCIIIQSEYPNCGELLAYYYFHKIKPFDIAIIIHDSTFIQSSFLEHVDTIKFLWTFKHNYNNHNDELKLINHLKADKIDELKYTHSNQTLWSGCFGLQSIITLKFLELLESEYNIFNLVAIIDNRKERCNTERIFAVLCHNLNKKLIKSNSIFGNIHKYIKWGYSYDEYISDSNNTRKIIKIWTGR